MTSKRKKENLAEKLNALKPSVPTSTRMIKTKKQPAKKTAKAVVPPPLAREERKPVPQKTESNQPTPSKIQVTTPSPTMALMPGMESLGTHFEKSLRLPWMMFDMWRGVAQAYYGLAESQVNFLVNMTSWRGKV